MSRLMFTQLLLCGFLYVRVDGKLKCFYLVPHPPETFLSESDVDCK